MRRIITLAMAFMAAAAVSAAQVPGPAPARPDNKEPETVAEPQRVVTALLVDSSTGEPISFATVSLTKAGEKSPSNYVLSDDKGNVNITKVARGKYTFKVELLGYKTYTKEITTDGTPLKLGEIKIEPDKEMLDAASVSATGNPIVVKKDTVEYNASSFKTTDNDMLVDLLKKLPGVEVSDDGTITANGQSISKITIDGKTFFLNDPSLASSNIPAKVIEKVKVVQKKSEQSEFTGIDDGNEETVIDLSIQKGMMNGTFGNLMGGLGHDYLDASTRDAGENGDYRYQGAGFVGKFTKENQFSVILNANNTNNRGFNDVAGGMMGGMMGGGGFRGQNGGITTSWLAGVNGNTSQLFDGKMQLEGNYLYNGTKNDVTETSDKETYLDNYNLNYHNESVNSRNTYGHRFGFRVDHKFSDNTSILFQPSFNFGGGDYSQGTNFSTMKDENGVTSKTNDGFSLNTGDSKSQSASGFLLLRQRLGIPGRTLTFQTRYSYSNTDMDGFNQSLTNNYMDGEIASADTVNQRFDQNQKSGSVSGELTYTEPLGNGFYVSGEYELSWNRNTSRKDTYDSGLVDRFDSEDREYNRTGELPNESYSNDIVNRYINQSIGANFMLQRENIHAQVGFAAKPTNTYNKTNGETYKNSVVNWAPTAMVFYDFNDNTNIRFFYFGQSSQPSTSQLMPVPDNTDPLNVSFGNPSLKPYFSHSVRGEFRRTNKNTFSTISLNFNAGLVQDPIVNATWYGLNGAQYSMPTNGHDRSNASVRLMFNSPIAKSNFSVSNNLNFSYSNSSNYIGSQFDMTGYYDPETGVMDYDKFNAAFPDLDDAKEFTLNKINTYGLTERLRFTYRNDFVEANLGAQTRMNKSKYTISTATNTTTWNNRIEASMTWTLPAGFGLKSDMDYDWYRGYTTQQDDKLVINAELTKLAFKDNVTFALRAYDILGESKNLSVSDASNYHLESINNTLGRYIIFSVTFRFGNFGKGMRGRGGMRGGPGGPGPMGPPPGGRR